MDWTFWMRRDSDLRSTTLFYKFEIEARTSFAVAVIIARLEKALKLEVHRNRINHWTYDITRHNAMIRILRNEKLLLGRLAGEGL